MTSHAVHGTLVGTGGWAYFRVPGQNSLRAYASTFNFVEVNSSYYEYPDLRAASLWRSRTPEDFQFSVRCHKDLTRALQREDNHMIDNILKKAGDICSVLRANVLAILLPKGFKIDEAKLAGKLERVAAAFDTDQTRIALELRCGVTDEIRDAMRENGIIHCVDVSKEQPLVESEVLYSRLFGNGQHNIYQFDDDEIKDIADKSAAPKFEKSILAFHGVRMYGDAARLKAFLQTGKFMQVTGQTGLDSLGAVLKEDSVFPVSKTDLVSRQGWKLFDLTIQKRVRLGKVLSRLPDKTYSSHEELMSSLEPYLPDLG